MMEIFGNFAQLWIDNAMLFTATYLTLNLISFSMYFIDKKRAAQKRWRISEAALITAAAFGPAGGILGMYLLRHKTKHLKFTFSVPLLLALHIAVALLTVFAAI